jgi:hypothetical protein
MFIYNPYYKGKNKLHYIFISLLVTLYHNVFILYFYIISHYNLIHRFIAANI